MPQTIKLKRSSTQGQAPSTGDLELGEVAINTYDGKMYIKKDTGVESIVEVSGGGGDVYSSGADFTGDVSARDVTARSKLIVNKPPITSDLLTTSRSIQDLAAWAYYVLTGSNYALTPEKYRDALDVNQDLRFSAADAYAINVFVGTNYSSEEHDTYNSLFNNPNNITSTFVQDVIDGDYDSAGVTIDMDASSSVAIEGDIAVSGTVDGVDVAGLSTTVAGKANLTGANFIGDVTTTGNVGIGTTSPANTLTVGATEDSTVDQDATVGIKCNANHKGIMLQENSGAEQWSIGVGEGGSLKFYDSAIATPAVTFEDVTGRVGIGTDTPSQALDVVGNIAVSGTVDGRDVAADGTKLDGLKGTLTTDYWDSLQWQQGASRALTTILTQFGDTQYVKHSGDTYKTYVDLSLDLIYSGTSGTNDAFGYLAIVAPNPANEPTINMGTCTTFSSGISYITAFSVSGDWTEYLSRYSGLSTNSDGSNGMGFSYKSVYNPNTNSTTVWVSSYGNPPSNGDTIYLHPFDWESSNTVINGDTLSIDNSSGSGVNFRRDFKIYLGRFQQRVGYKFQAKENLSSDIVTLDTIRMTTTEYEV